MMNIRDTIQVRSNLSIVVRERGKIVARRVGHNIFVNLGREWLAKLICYSSYTGPTGNPEIDHRIRYMGLGTGGSRQGALGLANGGVVGTDYPGTNLQTDTNPAVSVLERPVRVSWTGGDPPSTSPVYDPLEDTWLGQVAPVTGLTGHPTASETSFTRTFSTTEINGLSSYYNAVPLSEIGLFHNGADPTRPSNAANPTNTYVAYDTFDTIVKTVAVHFEINWTLRF